MTMDIMGFVNDLFKEAQVKNAVQYLFSILRVSSIESYNVDPFITFRKKVEKRVVTKEDVDSAEDFWSLLTNISRVAGGYRYNPYIFWASETKNYSEESKKLVRRDLAEILEEIFPSTNVSISEQQVIFLSEVFSNFDSGLKQYLNENPYIPLPHFEVLELLTKKPKGLYGFRWHFSNGQHAEYTRNSKGTIGTNIMPNESGIDFFVGDRDKMIQEWRVGEKRLYKLGIKGRYNYAQQWAPIVYPGKFDHFQEEAEAISEDERVQGIWFYLLCTGYCVIEFVVRMFVKLPKEKMHFPGNILLELVPQENPQVKGMPLLEDEFIYDGTLYLDDYSVEAIKKGLDTVQRTIDGIAFTFNKPAKWRTKYTIMGHGGSAAHPNEKDMTISRKLIKSVNDENDMAIDSAINWYKLGLMTDNKLNAFLCAHIAIEGLAVKLAIGELQASSFFGLQKEDKEVRRKRIKNIFDEYYKIYYATDLEKLISLSYFEGISSITSNMRRAFRAVFGENNSVIDEYFKGDKSINSLRGKLAHGEYSDWHYAEYMMIWERLERVQEIAQSFITRILLRITPGDKRPQWSGLQSFKRLMDRPTGTLAVTRLDIFPVKDWTIKANWIE